MSEVIIPIVLGMVMSFVGSLPPGVISIAVMDTAVRKSFHDGLLVAGGAAFIEFFQAMIAVLFSNVIVKSVFITKTIQYSAVPVFLTLGILLLLKKKSEENPGQGAEYAARSIGKGMLLGGMNMLVIPFWIFWSSYFASNGWIDFKLTSVLIFCTSVTAGTFLALTLYARLGLSLVNKTAVMAFWGRKTVGIIFLAFAAYHLVKIISE